MFVCVLVFWLLLVKFSVLAKRLARKTPLRTPLCRKEIISTKPRPKSAYDVRFIVLFHCFIDVVYLLSPALHNIFHTPMARYSLFVLKVPLNAN